MQYHLRHECSVCHGAAVGRKFKCWCSPAHRRAFNRAQPTEMPAAIRQIFAAPQIFAHPQMSTVVSAGSIFFSNSDWPSMPRFGAQRGYLNTITPSSYSTAST